MKEQRHFGYNPIGRWGCYFVSLGKIAEDVTGEELTDEQVRSVYQEAVNVNAMATNCYMKHPDTVLGLFVYELTGEVWACKYVGWWNADMVGTEPEMFGKYDADDVTHEVIRLTYNTGHHFGLHNWNPEPRLTGGEMTGRRLFQIVVPEEDIAA